MADRPRFQLQRFSPTPSAPRLGFVPAGWQCVALALALLSYGAVSYSQPGDSLSGRWQAEAMTVRWVIGEWGNACGPRPSGGGDEGGTVMIDQQGDELSIVNAADPAHPFSTDRCWAMHPELERSAHQGGRRSWSSTCRTEAGAARQEILQTAITATDDTITFRESGQYQFSLRGQTCTASSGRWRTYRRLPAAPSAPPPTAEAPPKPAENRCATPGAPARIEVRPARKLMRAGESFQFRANVVDAHGCALRTPVSWSLVPAAAAQLSDGSLRIPAGSPDAKLRVVASAATQSVEVSVEVVSAERYAALLATGKFDADGASAEAAAATITAGALGAAQTAPAPEPSGRKWTFVALVSAIALLFGLSGAVLLRRGAKRRAPWRHRPSARVSSSEVPVATAGAATRTRRPAGAPEPTQLESPAAPSEGKPATVCPICGTLYESRDRQTCPKDGAQLLPINA